MRRHDDPIEVSTRDEAPQRFIWRGALWRVLEVQSCWRETGLWWTGPAARAARGDQIDDDQIRSDLLEEITVWRVEAVNGLPGSRGIYDLVHASAHAQWRLQGVHD